MMGIMTKIYYLIRYSHFGYLIKINYINSKKYSINYHSKLFNKLLKNYENEKISGLTVQPQPKEQGRDELRTHPPA